LSKDLLNDRSKKNKTHAAVTEGGSALKRYQSVIVGKQSFISFIYFECCVWLGIIPGSAGLLLRKIFWPRLFRACGRGTTFGVGVTLRHPNRISLGENVIVSDACILDARNENEEDTINIGDETIMSNNVMISCKGGVVHIGKRAGIGAQTIIQSVNNCPVILGNDVMVGPQSYLVGGSNYNIDRSDIPMSQQGMIDDGGIHIDQDVWLGGKVTVLGGISIGGGAVVAAGAVVNKSVDSLTIVAGIPARKIKKRSVKI